MTEQIIQNPKELIHKSAQLFMNRPNEFNAQINSQYKILRKSGYKFRSIRDMERFFYPWIDQPEILQKADDPWLSSTTGFRQITYGQIVWNMLNLTNGYGIFEKRPYIQEGWRVFKGRPTAAADYAEAATTLPDSDKPDLATLNETLATKAHVFDASEISRLLSKTQDDTTNDPMKVLREFYAMEHVKSINEDLFTDADTLNTNKINSIDRLTASSAEITAHSYTAGDEDIFGVDRSANGWANAQSLYNASADRDLTESLLKQLIRSCRVFWGPSAKPVFVTGYDTLDRFSDWVDPSLRYQIAPGSEGVRYQPIKVNDHETLPGIGAGQIVNAYHNIPIIPLSDVPQDTISRVYLLDLNSTFIENLAPTQYFEGGISSGDPFAVDGLKDKGLVRTIHRLKSTNLPGQGKLRDLQ